MHGAGYRRLTSLAVCLLVLVQVALHIYLWHYEKQSVFFLLLDAAIVCSVITLTAAAIRNPEQWLTTLAVTTLGAAIRSLMRGPYEPLSWLDSGSFLFLAASAALWWRALQLFSPLALLETIPLRAPIEDATVLFGDPTEKHPNEDQPDSTTYTFQPNELNEIVVVAWQGLVHSVAYCSNYSLPGADLRHLLKQYSEGKKWNLVEKGYLYIREDGDRRLSCSVIPVIGISTTEYMNARTEHNKEEL